MSEELGKILDNKYSAPVLMDYSRLLTEAVEAGNVVTCDHYPKIVEMCEKLVSKGLFYEEKNDRGLHVYVHTENGLQLGLKCSFEKHKRTKFGLSKNKAPDDIIPLDEEKSKDVIDTI